MIRIQNNLVVQEHQSQHIIQEKSLNVQEQFVKNSRTSLVL